MECKITSTKSRSDRPRGGFTLIEFLVSIPLSLLAMGLVVSFAIYTSRSFAGLLNYADLENNSRLAVALKGAAVTVKDKILKNMSSRAATMLSDDIGAMGPVKLADVELAQSELIKIAFTLAEQGRITVVGPADKML